MTSIEIKKIRILRRQIEKIDKAIIARIAERLSKAKQIGKAKKTAKMPIKNAKREKCLRGIHMESAKRNRVSPILVKKIFKLLTSQSRKEQCSQ